MNGLVQTDLKICLLMNNCHQHALTIDDQFIGEVALVPIVIPTSVIKVIPIVALKETGWPHPWFEGTIILGL